LAIREKYAGVTLDNQAFGDRESGLLSIYIDGKKAASQEADRVVQYVGRGIAVIDESR